jgi:uncharacterized protein
MAKRLGLGPNVRRIDIHTHFAPAKFLEFAEREEGRPFILSDLYRRTKTLTEVAQRIDLLDRNEIDINVLVPVPWLSGFPKIASDRTLAAKAARLMNDELAQIIAVQPQRFLGVALLPTIDPETTVAELDRAIEQLGFAGAYVPVGPTAKRMDHPDYEALYRALVKLDVPLWLHPSRPPIIADYVDEQRSEYFDWQAVGWLHDTTSAMIRMVFSGVFDRYPDLRVITHHHGGFIPLLAPRLNSNWTTFEHVGHGMPTEISRPYIDHFRKFYCDTAASGYAPKALELALEFFGADRVLFGTDAPFDISGGDYFITETLRSIAAMPISPDSRSAILANNAKRCLNPEYSLRGCPSVHSSQ